MKLKKDTLFFPLLVTYLIVLFSLNNFAGFREYLIYGKIINTQKEPLKGVIITLFSEKSNQRIRFKTNKEGDFKFVGLSHGTYKVTIEKDGYQPIETEWKFKSPQAKIKKVEIDTITLVSKLKIKEIEKNKEFLKTFDKGKGFLKNGKYEEAEKIFHEIIKQKPDVVNAYFLLARSYHLQNKLEEAIPFYEKYSQLEPKFPSTYFYLGICYQKLKKIKPALASFETSIKLDSKNYIPYYNSGLIHFALGEVNQAITRFIKADEIKPENKEIIENLALCYVNKGDVKNSTKFLQKGIKLYKGNETKIKYLKELLHGMEGKK